MAQSGFTPILIYASGTATNVPLNTNLTSSSLGAELALNYADGKLFYKDSSNVVQVIGWKTTPVSAGGTGLTSGTSGGIPYYSSTSAITSSALLAANALMIGGGAATAPSTTTTGTGVVTALGINTGTAGAFLVNGGVLGTPSSGTLTNCTFPTLNQNTSGTAGGLSGNPNITVGTILAGNTQINSLGINTAASGTAGEIRATNNITAFYSSDIKFKENVRDIPNALATVNSIGGKLFDWNDAYIESRGGADGYFVQKADFGVIAQDVQKVFPIAVRTREDGSLAVDYEKLGVLAFAALVEITKRIEALEAK